MQCAGEAARLQQRKIPRECLALGREIEQSLAAVGSPGFLKHVAVLNEVAQYAPKALLGDFQNVEEIRDTHTGMTVDEMQHAMVRAAEAKAGEQFIGVADEIPVRKKQQLDQVIGGTAGAFVRRIGEASGCRRDVYVSHVDIFSVEWYGAQRFGETLDFGAKSVRLDRCAALKDALSCGNISGLRPRGKTRMGGRNRD
jgi:hypothetical protein